MLKIGCTPGNLLLQIMKFLTWISVVRGMSYSAINSARSALSAYVQRFGIYMTGAHPDVVRHIKGLHRKKPTPGKVKITWDVNTVFILLKS